MRTVNVHEAKTTLSRLLEEVERGETVIIARNGQPIAELKAIKKPTLSEILAEMKSEFPIRMAGFNVRDAIDEGRR